MRLLLGFCASALLALCVPAEAYWKATGSGSGSAVVTTMPAGNQPSATASATSVTVSWSQSTFAGAPLGSYSGGGYTIRRYAQGSSTAITPNASCATAVSGSAATLQCVEGSVPYGTWQYTVTPVLNSFTGAASAKSATVTVATSAPTLNSATAQNPASGQSTGDIQLSWSGVTGATGYNVYRRTASGSYDYTSPLNGATPVTATTYTDAGSGLTGSTTYDYVVRAVAGSPAVESASSAEKAATAIARPSAPAGAVTATAVVNGAIDVSWSAVSGVAGYNVYRRTLAGNYDYASPLNGATPLTATSYHDTGASNGTTYVYAVRSIITGAGGAQVESASSADSNSATSDSSPPPAPSAVDVTGPTLATTTCGLAAGTRYVNNAGKSAVAVSATIATPESGETVVFSASRGAGSVSATVAATGTTVSTTLNLSSLGDGTLTVTARTQDAAGNQSATKAPTYAVVKDTVSTTPSALAYTDNLTIVADALAGVVECAAAVTITETAPSSQTFSTTAAADGSFSRNVAALSGAVFGIAYSYTVTATDPAGNVSASASISGTDTK
jgi:cellulose 1,4-beta-cellobiosidase